MAKIVYLCAQGGNGAACRRLSSLIGGSIEEKLVRGRNRMLVRCPEGFSDIASAEQAAKTVGVAIEVLAGDQQGTGVTRLAPADRPRTTERTRLRSSYLGLNRRPKNDRG